MSACKLDRQEGERIYDLCADGATFINAEVVDRRLDLLPLPLVLFRGDPRPRELLQAQRARLEADAAHGRVRRRRARGSIGMQSLDGRVPHAVFRCARRCDFAPLPRLK